MAVAVVIAAHALHKILFIEKRIHDKPKTVFRSNDNLNRNPKATSLAHTARFLKKGLRAFFISAKWKSLVHYFLKVQISAAAMIQPTPL